MVGVSPSLVARRPDYKGHSIGSWCLNDPSQRINAKPRTTMVLFGNMSSFLGTIAFPVLAILQHINFAHKRTSKRFSRSHHCQPSTDDNLIVPMWEIRVVDCKYHVGLIPHACISIPTRFWALRTRCAGFASRPTSPLASPKSTLSRRGSLVQPKNSNRKYGHIPLRALPGSGDPWLGSMRRFLRAQRFRLTGFDSLFPFTGRFYC